MLINQLLRLLTSSNFSSTFDPFDFLNISVRALVTIFIRSTRVTTPAALFLDAIRAWISRIKFVISIIVAAFIPPNCSRCFISRGITAVCKRSARRREY